VEPSCDGETDEICEKAVDGAVKESTSSAKMVDEKGGWLSKVVLTLTTVGSLECAVGNVVVISPLLIAWVMVEVLAAVDEVVEGG
jgi:hypothetical protein